MSLSRREKQAWQQSLTSAFSFQETENGLMPTRVSALTESEAGHCDAITERGYGFRVIMLSYQDFALRTLEEAPKHGNVINPYNYAMNWAAMRGLRSSWNTYNDGYYENAASFLRSVLEITTYLSCVLRGCFGFQRIHELGKDIDLDKLTPTQFIKETRILNNNLSREILDKVYGESSGLSKSQQEDMKVLRWIQHSHVHRGEASVVREVLKMVESKGMPPLVPAVDLDRASVFCNASVLAAWTHVRVLPYLSAPSQYSDGWQEQYRVLDEGMKGYIEPWEKPMRDAHLALIKTSFSFDESIALRQVLGESAS